MLSFLSTRLYPICLLFFVIACQGSFNSNGTPDNDPIASEEPTSNQPVASCSSCHPSNSSDNTAWRTMSGLHNMHLRENNITCADCHVETTSDNVSIDNAALHQNGINDVAFTEPGMTFDSDTLRCSGPCHGENHQNDSWNDNDDD